MFFLGLVESGPRDVGTVDVEFAWSLQIIGRLFCKNPIQAGISKMLMEFRQQTGSKNTAGKSPASSASYRAAVLKLLENGTRIGW